LVAEPGQVVAGGRSRGRIAGGGGLCCHGLPTSNAAAATIIFPVIAAPGFWVFGVAVLAVLALGAGNVALNEIRPRGERDDGLAIAALVIGFGIAAVAWINILGFIPSAVKQFSM
jgi:hypothetical protein